MPHLPTADRSYHSYQQQPGFESAQQYQTQSRSDRSGAAKHHAYAVDQINQIENDPFADASFLPEFDPDYEEISHLPTSGSSSYVSVSSSMRSHTSPEYCQHPQTSPQQSAHQQHPSMMPLPRSNHSQSSHQQPVHQQPHSITLPQHFRPTARSESFEAIVDAACGNQISSRHMHNQERGAIMTEDLTSAYHMQNATSQHTLLNHSRALAPTRSMPVLLALADTSLHQHQLQHPYPVTRHQPAAHASEQSLPRSGYGRAPSVSYSNRVPSHPYQMTIQSHHQAAKQRHQLPKQHAANRASVPHMPRSSTFPVGSQSVEHTILQNHHHSPEIEIMHAREARINGSSLQAPLQSRTLERGSLAPSHHSHLLASHHDASHTTSFHQSQNTQLIDQVVSAHQSHGFNHSYPSYVQSSVGSSERSSRQNLHFNQSPDQSIYHPNRADPFSDSDYVAPNHFAFANNQQLSSQQQHVSYAPNHNHVNHSQHSTAAPIAQQRSASIAPVSTPIIQPHELADKYVVLDYLGSGSYGSVHLAERKSDGRRVAVKKIINIFENLTNAKRLLREIKILRMLNHQSIDSGRHNTQSSTHENVIGFYHLCPVNDLATFNDLCIVFEFVDTDLQKLIHSHQQFSNLHVQFFMYQLIVGVAYVHSASIIHRDIKPANVLVNADCSLKVCDFGLSRFAVNDGPDRNSSHVNNHINQLAPTRSRRLSSISSLPSSLIQLPTPPSRARRELTKHVVTRWYRAPELILLSDHYSTAIDIWSIGCILAELLSMQQDPGTSPEDRQALFPGRSCFPLSADHPHAYADQLDQLNVIFDVIGTPSAEDLSRIDNDTARTYLNNLPDKPSIDLFARYPGADTRAIDLLMRMLCFNPSKRISALECLQHPYFDEVRDDSISLQWRTVNPSANPHKEFAFEDADMNEEQIRALLIEEILIDQPHLAYPPRMSPSSNAHSQHYHPSHLRSTTAPSSQHFQHPPLHSNVMNNHYASTFRSNSHTSSYYE